MRSTSTVILIGVAFMATAATVYAAGISTVAVADDAGDPSRHLVLMIVYATVALFFSSLCSVAEAVLLSVTPSYIANLKTTSPTIAARLGKVKRNIDRSLAAILTLNTIAHTVGAGGAGAEAAAYFGAKYVGVAMAVLTLLILFVSEIIPKTIGALYWRNLASVTARFVQQLTWILYPLLLISDLLTRLITRGKAVHAISRDEIAAMAELGMAAGQLDENESRILKNVFRLPGLQVSDIMTPRTVLFALQQDLTSREVITAHPSMAFSRIPIFAAHRDEVTGFVLKSDLYANIVNNSGEAKLRDLKRGISSVPDQMPLNVALEKMLTSREHILLVVDEHGGLDGIVTLEDLVETLIGIEIVDEGDQIDDMRRLARQKWRERMERLGIDLASFDAKSDE
ncbi:CNNM domain-containing protein [Bythopirellula polymerisocia]|uniref:Hemolysin C n=1 Tax=Bythopirellula polymerisocia TaxID=2528003 RepID=A0A5C6D0C8_9BACT|nr:CNNM domain-containing protein [Bythopirellula polymerisocia]TWU30168.1 Hemolysin C [Bythopirellula polymerisocia]